jgi:hypothetical protein
MTAITKRFVRPLVLAGAFAALFAVLPGGSDPGAFLGITAAQAAGHGGGGHGGMGGGGRGHSGVGDRDVGGGAPRNGGGTVGAAATGNGISQGAPHNGGANSDPAASSDPHGIAAGVDSDRARDRVECAWYDCH